MRLCTYVSTVRTYIHNVHVVPPQKYTHTHTPSSSRMLTTAWSGFSTTPGNWAVLVVRVAMNLSVASMMSSSRIGTTKLNPLLSESNVNLCEKPL